jgi:hypothetical protein
MAAGATYTPIATYTLSSAQAAYTFSSIPSTYTDLVVVINGTFGAFNTLFMQFNGDTSSIYSDTGLNGSGSAASSYRSTGGNASGAGGMGATRSTTIIQVQNYSNASVYKTTLWRANSPSDYVQAGVSLWRSTAAINSITFTANATTFQTGSTFTLYGIAAA